MATYRNCYSLVESVRMGLNEYSEAKVQGTDTVGAFTNTKITEKINEAIRELYALIVRRVPEIFLEETTITGVNSVFTLPWNFGRLVLFRDENGNMIWPMTQKARRLNSATGRKRLYYRKGNTLVLDRTGVSLSYTLTYLRKPRDIHHGAASAGAATSMTLATTAPPIVDYFNGMEVENITKAWVDTIDDYAASRVATISETAAASDYYGIIPEIPEWAHFLISPRAVFKMGLESPVGQKQPVRTEQTEWYEMVRTTLVEFAAPSGDIDWEELFTAYEPSVPQILGIISD